MGVSMKKIIIFIVCLVHSFALLSMEQRQQSYDPQHQKLTLDAVDVAIASSSSPSPTVSSYSSDRSKAQSPTPIASPLAMSTLRRHSIGGSTPRRRKYSNELPFFLPQKPDSTSNKQLAILLHAIHVNRKKMGDVEAQLGDMDNRLQRKHKCSCRCTCITLSAGALLAVLANALNAWLHSSPEPHEHTN